MTYVLRLRVTHVEHNDFRPRTFWTYFVSMSFSTSHRECLCIVLSQYAVYAFHNIIILVGVCKYTREGVLSRGELIQSFTESRKKTSLISIDKDLFFSLKRS